MTDSHHTAESPTVPNATFKDLSAEVEAFMARMAERYTPIAIMVTIQLPDGIGEGSGWWCRGNESAIYGGLRRHMLRLEAEWRKEFCDTD